MPNADIDFWWVLRLLSFAVEPAAGSKIRQHSRSRINRKEPGHLLFLFAFNGCKHSKMFRELYDRIVKKNC